MPFKGIVGNKDKMWKSWATGDLQSSWKSILHLKIESHNIIKDSSEAALHLLYYIVLYYEKKLISINRMFNQQQQEVCGFDYGSFCAELTCSPCVWVGSLTVVAGSGRPLQPWVEQEATIENGWMTECVCVWPGGLAALMYTDTFQTFVIIAGALVLAGYCK